MPTSEPRPHERMSQHAHDRLHVRRDDEEWLARQWADPRSRALVVAGNRLRVRGGAVDWVAPADAPAGTRLLLGENDGGTRFAVLCPPDRADASDPATGGTAPSAPSAPGAPADIEWLPLRGLLPAFAAGAGDHGEGALVLHALGLAEWLSVTRFCPRCGGSLSVRSAGHQLVCHHGHVQFPRTDPAVIMLIATGEPGGPDERCLLGRQRVWPEGRFSTLAGFCEPGESLEDSVRREVAEEVGVRVGEVTYFGNQPWPLPASLMLGFTGRATSTEISADEDEIAEARWFTRAELATAAGSGAITLPGEVSISRSLIEAWYGGPLPGSW